MYLSILIAFINVEVKFCINADVALPAQSQECCSAISKEAWNPTQIEASVFVFHADEADVINVAMEAE